MFRIDAEDSCANGSFPPKAATSLLVSFPVTGRSS
jgi:hypothetical protein